MRLWIPLLISGLFLAPLAADEKKKHQVDFGFFGRGAVNRRHHPLLFGAAFNSDEGMVFGRNLESRPGCERDRAKPAAKKKSAKPKRKYHVVCVERKGVRTYPVVAEEKLKAKVDENKDASVTPVAGPIESREDADRKAAEILKQDRARQEAMRAQGRKDDKEAQR